MNQAHRRVRRPMPGCYAGKRTWACPRAGARAGQFIAALTTAPRSYLRLSAAADVVRQRTDPHLIDRAISHSTGSIWGTAITLQTVLLIAALLMLAGAIPAWPRNWNPGTPLWGKDRTGPDHHNGIAAILATRATHGAAPAARTAPPTRAKWSARGDWLCDRHARSGRVTRFAIDISLPARTDDRRGSEVTPHA